MAGVFVAVKLRRLRRLRQVGLNFSSSAKAMGCMGREHWTPDVCLDLFANWHVFLVCVDTDTYITNTSSY